MQLLPQLITLLEKPQQPHTEIVCRTALFLVRVHHGPIMSTTSLLPTIRQLHMLAASKIAELRVNTFKCLPSLQFTHCYIFYNFLVFFALSRIWSVLIFMAFYSFNMKLNQGKVLYCLLKLLLSENNEEENDVDLPKGQFSHCKWVADFFHVKIRMFMML